MAFSDGRLVQSRMSKARFSCIARASILALAMMLSAIALTTGPTANGTASDELTLRIGFPDKVDSMNPMVGLTGSAHTFYSLIYDGLFRVDEDMGIEGNLAVSWNIDADFEPYGSVWRYNLTENATWHDGEPFTADDVVFTINLNANNYTQMWAYQPYAYYLDYAEKVDDYAVRIHFYDRSTDEPKPISFGDALTIPILPRHLLAEMTAAEIGFMWEGVFESTNPPVVGTGPFMATENIYPEYLDGHILKLVKNPRYHRAIESGQEIGYDSLEMHYFADSNAMAEAFTNGEIDLAKFNAPEFDAIREEMEGNDNESVEFVSAPSCVQHLKVLDFDMRPIIGNPLRLDPLVRKAMAMAVDKSTVVSSPGMLNGGAVEGSTIISSADADWHCGLSDDEELDYDIDGANALLEAAGYRFTEQSPDIRVAAADSWAVQEGMAEEGANLTFDLAYRSDRGENPGIAENLRSEWEEIGIRIRLRIDDYRPLCPVFYEYEIMLWDFWGRSPDPQSTLFVQSKAAWNGWNDNSYYNPDYDGHYNESISALDDDVRRAHVLECQRIHYNDTAYIVLAEMNGTYALRTDTFQGWGDWCEHPGRSIDNPWGASELYFDLEPVPDSESDWTLMVAVGLIVAACAVVAVVVLRRRK
jgi:peptide/nickel transport system substrate-binding protein